MGITIVSSGLYAGCNFQINADSITFYNTINSVNVSIRDIKYYEDLGSTEEKLSRQQILNIAQDSILAANLADQIARTTMHHITLCYKDNSKSTLYMSVDEYKSFQLIKSRLPNKTDFFAARRITINKDNYNASIERIKMFISDNDWEMADIYCDAVLDYNPQSGEVYLYKLFIDFNVKSIQEFYFHKEFILNINLKRVLEFADSKIKDELIPVVEKVTKEVLNEQTAQKNYDNFWTENKHKKDQINNYINFFSNKIALLPSEHKQLKDKLNQILNAPRTESITFSEEELSIIATAATLFRDISAQLEKKASDEKAKKKKKIKTAIIVLVVLAIIVTGGIIAAPFIEMQMEYNNAKDLFDAGEFDEAIAIFEDLGEFSDSEDRLHEVNNEKNYRQAVEYFEEKMYSLAARTFEDIDSDYKDTAEKLSESRYYAAKDYEMSSIVSAYNYYKLLPSDYRDTADRMELIEKYLPYTGTFIPTSYTKYSDTVTSHSTSFIADMKVDFIIKDDTIYYKELSETFELQQSDDAEYDYIVKIDHKIIDNETIYLAKNTLKVIEFPKNAATADYAQKVYIYKK